ncbi:Alg9-like mannosyltransferase family-domain-containing protein [Chaetomidium leptoderma]|uniref:Mannosyltransferase n=1 Tax=Chaetomidium leptoderma TaxID=669021 RepID=A0AAN6VX93_9PEZI|nr:Alg9-like mannosyltransferase family-domain-containing protein [Chaetomidium leptoderma]
MEPSKKAQLGAKSAAADGRGLNSTVVEASGSRLLDTLLSLLIPGLILAHLVAAPYTKVEESFNIQAAHDVLVYGTPTSDMHQKLSNTYDHFTFSGAVPRTFVGPVLLAGLAQPIVALVGFQHAQLVVRAILGLFNAACLLVFAKNLKWAYGTGTARWYLLLQASQFHIMFYASRTLPNMFAFGLTTLAFAFLLPQPGKPKSTARRQRLSITMFVFAAVVFRSEVALLLGTTVLHLLIIPALSLERVLFPFTVSVLIALATSVPIDSYFWQRPLWPELWGFYYNVVQGSASDWGVSPWHYYFTSALPRLLINPLTYTLLIPFALWHPALRSAASSLTIPSILFTTIYSLQPHKETRFIFYVVPPLTAAAALSANLVFTRRGKSPLATLLALALALSILGSLAASTAMLAVSALNYPGGDALAHLRSTILSDSRTGSGSSSIIIPVHADVLSCMTGVTLFGSSTASSAADEAAAQQFVAAHHGEQQQLLNPTTDHNNGGNSKNAETVKVNHRHHSGGGGGNLDNNNNNNNNGVVGQTTVVVAVDKTEDKTLLARADFWRQFAYVLVQDPAEVPRPAEWEAVGVVKGYGGIEVVRPGHYHDDDEDDSSGVGTTGAPAPPPVVGRGKIIELWKRRVRATTGGWWIGPRMVERIYILRRRVKDATSQKKVAVESRYV